MQALLAAALFGSLLGLLCPTNSLSSPSPSAPGGNSAPTEHVVPVESERPVPVAQIATLEYDQIMFLAQPPGCDAYLHGSADGHTWWGGCNTFGCAAMGIPGVDCQPLQQGAGIICECPGALGAGRATCWAAILFSDDGETVSGLICTKNGCGTDCSIWLWWKGNFYPCNC